MNIRRRKITIACATLVLAVLLPTIFRGDANAQSGGVSDANSSVEAPKQYFDYKLSQARELAESKKYASSLEIISGIIALEPSEDILLAARAMHEAVENARIRAEVLEAEVETDGEIYETGGTVKITVRLYNRSLESIKVPQNVEEKRSLFGSKQIPVPSLIRIRYTTLDFYIGGVAQSTYNTSVEYDEEINLEPGEFWEKEFEFKLDAYMPSRGVVRRLSLSLKILPIIYRRNDVKDAKDAKTVWYQYQTLERTIGVLPVGASQYRADPVKSAVAALEADDGLALLYSVGCADNRQRAILLPIIMAHLEKATTNSPLERYMIVVLQHITAKYGRLKKDMWLDWWRSSGEDFLRRLYPAMRRTVFEVAIAANGALSQGGEVLSAEEVDKRIKQFIYNGGVEFVIRCSKKAEFSHVAELMRRMDAAGADNIRIFAAEDNDGSQTDE